MAMWWLLSFGGNRGLPKNINEVERSQGLGVLGAALPALLRTGTALPLGL